MSHDGPDLCCLKQVAEEINELRDMHLRLGCATAFMAPFLAVWCLAVTINKSFRRSICNEALHPENDRRNVLLVL
jgi:hypothetical protein